MDLGRLGVRARAMLLVLIAAVPVGLLIHRTTAEQRHHHRQMLAEQAEHFGRVVSARYSEMLSYAGQALAVAAAEIEDAAPDACEARMRRIANSSPVHSLSLADPAGRIRCSSMPAGAGVEIGDRDFFLRAISSRGFSSSGIAHGRISDRVVVLAGYPVLDDRGSLKAVAVAEVVLDWIPRALADSGAPPGFAASLVSDAGEVLQAFADERALTVDRDSGALRPRNPGGDFVSGRIRLPTPFHEPAFLRVELPAALADGPADAALRAGMAWLIGMFALVLAIAWLGATYFVVRPLKRLEQAAGRLDSGDLTARTGVPHSGHEIGRLARALDELAAHREKVTRALRALSAGNRALLREVDETALIRAMCQVAVERGGYPLAVVYYAADDDDRSVVPAAHAGEDRGLLDALKLTWADDERGQGTVARSIRSGRTVVFQSIVQEPGSLPWREYLLERGFGSVASMPLKVEERVIGTFTLFAAETNAFDREELELVQEMAEDLAFGIATCRDRITRTDLERETRRAATHDGVTDLFNRSHFIAQLGSALGECASRSEPLAVIVVHVRNLPALLDGLGYAPGMEVLREVAHRLGMRVPVDDVLARVPQDDFVVLRRGANAHDAEALARQLLGAFATPVTVGGAEIDVQGHAGASLFPGHGDEPDLLLRRATIASRDAAKHDSAFALYAGATERENPERLALVAEMRRAIAARSMQLHYQAKFDLATGRVIGSEALLRWQSPGRGNVPPGQFVPLAEQTGLIGPLTYMVIENALRQQRAWLDMGLRLPVAVNLSARNLFDPKLRERIEGLLATWGIAGELLQVEITEGAVVADPGAARNVLEALRGLGCRAYIDDFGTGYSSLSYLVSLPVHALKIDRSFVAQMTENREAHTVVSAIISMAHGLGLRVVAEGVEREDERSKLIALGCDEAQGYLLGRPVAAEDFPASVG